VILPIAWMAFFAIGAIVQVRWCKHPALSLRSSELLESCRALNVSSKRWLLCCCSS
jgi:hypothetical protein